MKPEQTNSNTNIDINLDTTPIYFTDNVMMGISDAGLVLDGMLVEEIFAQVVLAGAKLKTRRRQECEMQALLGADRAVAGGNHGKVGGAFETHHAAMAAAGVGFCTGHRSASAP